MAKSKKTSKATRDDEMAVTAQREQLARTLEALSGQLGQDQLLGEAVGAATAYGRRVSKRVAGAARENPQTAVMAGAGVALMAFGAAKLLSRPAPAPKPVADDRLRALEERIAELGAKAGKETRNAAETVTDNATLRHLVAALNSVKTTEPNLRAAASSTPAMLGLGALAAGALAMVLRSGGASQEPEEALVEALDENTDLDTSEIDPELVQQLLRALNGAAPASSASAS